MNRFQFYQAACATPYVTIADPKANADEILKITKNLSPDIQLVLFPELCLSGYSCQDLFYQPLLQRACLESLEYLCKNLPENTVVLVGLPLVIRHRLYNAAAFIFSHEVLGFQIKSYLPNYNEFYEKRWFSSARELKGDETITFMGKEVPVGNKLLFEDSTTRAVIGIEICEDLWASIPISSHHVQAGANIICNLSASNDAATKDAYRLELVKNQSARQYCAYLYACAGPSESTMDLIFGGQDIIAQSGEILACSSLSEPAEIIEADLDIELLENDHIHFGSLFDPISRHHQEDYRLICYQSRPIETITLKKNISAYPFIPKEEKERFERCRQILLMQAYGLTTRLEKTKTNQVVLGLSGGLDSTLALLVCLKAFELLKLDPSGIHCILMPGFGTSDLTKSNAKKLTELCHVSSRVIDITKACLQHFKDIGHNPAILDTTYENVQARERTQILMDIANQIHGLVIGTGDLSELALGWCTYNGDHMSMYSVNSSIPKTLIRFIIETQAMEYARKGQTELEKVLLSIIDTPISPELLPPDQTGKIAQKTEEILGSYDLHDFFLYHMLRYHESPKKIYALACHAFKDLPREKILDSLKTFYRRFFSQQFKRDVLPDGVKVGSISFSPRGDWRMPSDASASLWMSELETLQADSDD